MKNIFITLVFLIVIVINTTAQFSLPVGKKYELKSINNSNISTEIAGNLSEFSTNQTTTYNFEVKALTDSVIEVEVILKHLNFKSDGGFFGEVNFDSKKDKESEHPMVKPMLKSLDKPQIREYNRNTGKIMPNKNDDKTDKSRRGGGGMVLAIPGPGGANGGITYSLNFLSVDFSKKVGDSFTVKEEDSKNNYKNKRTTTYTIQKIEDNLYTLSVSSVSNNIVEIEVMGNSGNIITDTKSTGKQVWDKNTGLIVNSEVEINSTSETVIGGDTNINTRKSVVSFTLVEK